MVDECKKCLKDLDDTGRDPLVGAYERFFRTIYKKYVKSVKGIGLPKTKKDVEDATKTFEKANPIIVAKIEDMQEKIFKKHFPKPGAPFGIDMDALSECIIRFGNYEEPGKVMNQIGYGWLFWIYFAERAIANKLSPGKWKHLLQSFKIAQILQYKKIHGGSGNVGKATKGITKKILIGLSPADLEKKWLEVLKAANADKLLLASMGAGSSLDGGFFAYAVPAVGLTAPWVIKGDGDTELYEPRKLAASLLLAGATLEDAFEITNEHRIGLEPYDKVHSSDIRSFALEHLKERNPAWEHNWHRYDSRRKLGM